MRFEVQFKQSDQKLSVRFQQMVTVKPDVEYYTGEYSVTPKVDSQSLPTKERFLTKDVEIVAIPYFDVGNNSGGTTVYIGSVDEMKN